MAAYTKHVGTSITIKTLSARIADAAIRAIYRDDLTVDEAVRMVDTSTCQRFGREVKPVDMQVVRNLVRYYVEKELAS